MPFGKRSTRLEQGGKGHTIVHSVKYKCIYFLLPLGVLQMSSDFCIQTKNSEEYKVVKKHFGPIVNRIQHVLPVLANELFSRDLISDVEHGDAICHEQQPV